MTLLQVILLAIVQGVTEFLPISSSGHLVIVAALMGRDVDVKDVNIVLHAGTLLSILVFFWQRVWQLIGRDVRVIPRLVVGTIPAGVLGVLIKKNLPDVLENPLLAGAMLLVTGTILWVAGRWQHADGAYHDLTMGRALGIGVAQSVALLPGISRSGSTIAAGLGMGLSRRDAATFSFLLAIPAIGGASLLELIDVIQEPNSLTTELWILAVGALVAFGVGVVSLWWLLRLLERGRLEQFAWWCWPVGLGVIIWQLMA